MINTHNGIKEKGVEPVNINDYSAVKKHLDQFYPQLEKRLDKGITPYHLRNCAYTDDFNRQKITYMEIMTDNPQDGYDFPCFSFDTEKCVALNTAYIITGNINELKFILGILNSKLGRLLVKYYVVQLQQRQFRMLNQDVVNFPIPKNKEMKPISILVEQIITNKKQAKSIEELERKVDDLVCQLFDFNADEIAFIESQ